ncbi:hypothetical protein BSL78_07898 [Apostichopus japonicus]|uniref:RRM domain-containing protein n=1 Tax=Stichopus japonicus TaxID=307972 RepID=A0A2G8L4K9_STIJA|nr:hypothetical protein BSL78_07898 [Apostichopus japonicus]
MAKLSSHSVTAEVIRFMSPQSERTNLYVTGLMELKLSSEQIYIKLHTVFSEFGLLYEIQVFPSTKHGPQEEEDKDHAEISSRSYYAFVKFYSSFAAAKAVATLNKKYLIHGKLLKVSFATRKVKDDYPLHYSACCSLAQYYLGFNGWSSHVVHIHEDKDHGDPTLVRFLCATKLNIPKHHITCEGIGLSENTFPDVNDLRSRLEAIKKTRRNSFSRAMENAFQQIALVVLSNGKVAVELCSEKPDEMVFLVDLLRKQIIEVNNVEGLEEEMTEKQDNSVIPKDGSLLDAMNNEILLDLMMDI